MAVSIIQENLLIELSIPKLHTTKNFELIIIICYDIDIKETTVHKELAEYEDRKPPSQLPSIRMVFYVATYKT